MTSSEYPVVTRMQALIDEWEQASDSRALFLRTYLMMTENMLAAIDEDQFADPAWVNRLLHLFAHYYFVALEAYEAEDQVAPAAWQLAFDKTREPHTLALQKLLLGVNAHINYDLVLSLAEILRPEWSDLSPEEREKRHADHNRVNEIIVQTTDAVQDEVLEPSMPWMDLIDRIFGPVDEYIISSLIGGWRDHVWENVLRLLDAKDQDEARVIIRQVESHAMQTGHMIGI